jgi:hypothetical protein
MKRKPIEGQNINLIASDMDLERKAKRLAGKYKDSGKPLPFWLPLTFGLLELDSLYPYESVSCLTSLYPDQFPA